MMTTYSPPDERALFEDFVSTKLKLSKKTKVNRKAWYEHYAMERIKKGLEGRPIDYSTFCRWFKKFVSTSVLIKAEQGPQAARRYNATNKGVHVPPGFLLQYQADGHFAHIKILSSTTLRARPKQPVHFFVLEANTWNVVGHVLNVHTGSETSDFVINSYKSAFLPKSHLRERYGAFHLWNQYGKPYEILFDAGPAYLANICDLFLHTAYVDGVISRTRTPQDKWVVEAFNGVFKDYVVSLPGGYDDDKDGAADRVEPVLTDLEYEIIVNRWITDIYHQKIPTSCKVGISRQAKWDMAAQFYPPELPDNVQRMIEFNGQKGEKFIHPSRGIRIQIANDKFTYNSRRLRELRETLEGTISDPKKRKVSYTWSITKPHEIQVKDPITDDLFTVNRLSNEERVSQVLTLDEKTTLRERYIAEQTLEHLSLMSTEDIIEYAKRRKRLLDGDRRRQRSASKSRAVAIEHMASEDTQKTFAFLAEQPSPTQSSVEEPCETTESVSHSDALNMTFRRFD